MQIIGAAINKLNDLETLVPILQGLALRHNTYGVKENDYQTVSAALLTTLEQGLEDAFTAEVKNAWAEVYGVMTDVMISAASRGMENLHN